jgi:hypothetical protein
VAEHLIGGGTDWTVILELAKIFRTLRIPFLRRVQYDTWCSSNKMYSTVLHMWIRISTLQVQYCIPTLFYCTFSYILKYYYCS